MHSRGYTHNDIKPQNILYNSPDTFKLIDFGLCNYMGLPIPNSMLHFAGTENFKAPDSTRDKNYHQGNRYNYNSDMYSVGAIMFWACMGANSIFKHIKLIIDPTSDMFKSYIPLFLELYGEQGTDFMEKCLDNNTRSRISSKRALNHPYFTQTGGMLKYNLYKFTNSDLRHQLYELEYLDDFYNNYKNTQIYIPKITDQTLYVKNTQHMLTHSLEKNMPIESFIQYVFIYHTSLQLFPHRNMTDLSICSYSIATKLYEDTSSNIMIRVLIDKYKIQTKYEDLIGLELEILDKTRFDLPLIPISSVIYYKFLQKYGEIEDIDKYTTALEMAIQFITDTTRSTSVTLDELGDMILGISIQKASKNIIDIYETAMKYHSQGKNKEMIELLLKHIDMFSDKEYLPIMEALTRHI